MKLATGRRARPATSVPARPPASAPSVRPAPYSRKDRTSSPAPPRLWSTSPLLEPIEVIAYPSPYLPIRNRHAKQRLRPFRLFHFIILLHRPLIISTPEPD